MSSSASPTVRTQRRPQSSASTPITLQVGAVSARPITSRKIRQRSGEAKMRQTRLATRGTPSSKVSRAVCRNWYRSRHLTASIRASLKCCSLRHRPGQHVRIVPSRENRRLSCSRASKKRCNKTQRTVAYGSPIPTPISKEAYHRSKHSI